jgi:hypothetical protein
MLDLLDSSSKIALSVPQTGVRFGKIIGRAVISGTTVEGKFVSEEISVYEGGGSLVTLYRYRNYTATYFCNGIITSVTASLGLGFQPVLPGFI